MISSLDRDDRKDHKAENLRQVYEAYHASTSGAWLSVLKDQQICFDFINVNMINAVMINLSL